MNAVIPFNSKQSWTAFALMILALTAIYGGHLNMPYFGDDYQQVYYHPLHAVTAYLFARPPYAERYIPIQTAVLALSQWTNGLDTSLIRIFNILVGSLVCWFSWHLALRLGLSRRASALTAGFLVVSQLTATAILMNDSPSQILSTVAGLIVLLLAFEYSKTNSKGLLVGVAGGIFLGLLSKETFVGWFIPLLILLSLRFNSERWYFRSAKEISTFAVVIVTMFLVYFWFHAHIGLPGGKFGNDRYDLHIGTNLPLNVAQLLFADNLPLSTVWVYIWILHRTVGPLLLAALAVFIVAMIAFAGIFRLRKFWVLILFGTLGSISPVIFLNHVAELYAYSLLPFVALVFGAGCETLMSSKSKTWLMSVIVIVLFGLNVWSSHSKQLMMLSEGQLHGKLLSQLQNITRNLPVNSRLYLVNPVQSGDEYSTFIARGFHLFQAGESGIGVPIGRSDINACVIEQNELDSVLHVHPGVAVTFDTTSLKVSILPPLKTAFCPM